MMVLETSEEEALHLVRIETRTAVLIRATGLSPFGALLRSNEGAYTYVRRMFRGLLVCFGLKAVVSRLDGTKATFYTPKPISTSLTW